jgi:hypothetical protein
MMRVLSRINKLKLSGNLKTKKKRMNIEIMSRRKPFTSHRTHSRLILLVSEYRCRIEFLITAQRSPCKEIIKQHLDISNNNMDV